MLLTWFDNGSRHLFAGFLNIVETAFDPSFGLVDFGAFLGLDFGFVNGQ